MKNYPKEVSFFTLLNGLAGRAGLVVKAVAEPHALQTGSQRLLFKKPARRPVYDCPYRLF